jgi:Domain of unknown function (DUF4440)
MRFTWGFVILLLLCSLNPARAQQMKRGDKDWVALEKTLEDTNNQWLCAYQYYKPKAQDCVDFRAKFWPDQFFEVGRTGMTQTREQMVAGQTTNAAKNPSVVRGQGPNPQNFKLMSVYGDIALATDHTVFKAPDANGNLVVTGEANVLRMFERENGRWRPAGAVLIPAP